MKFSTCILGGVLIYVAFLESAQSLCVLESDFGFKINCAFKKSGLFRVRNLGGLKAHASLGFSLGDELGFEQSLTNQDPSRRRSTNVKNGAPSIIVDSNNRQNGKQEKRGKQNRIMMRPVPQLSRPNQAAMDRLSTLHQRASTTMKPIIVSGPTDTTNFLPKVQSTQTMAKPMPMGVPPFRPLPPKEDTLKVLPVASRKNSSPLQSSQSKGPVYATPQSQDLASPWNIKKADDYNSISGYSDDTTLKFNKDDINEKIAEIAKAGNISMEAVEAAIALRQQQLLSKYANLPVPTTPSTTTTTQEPIAFELEPEPEIIVAPAPNKPKRNPTSGKVMNAPREYYPVGYEKNFDDHFQSKVDLPETNFHCGDQKYFPGLYGDENLGCMVFHVCALTDDGLVMKSFLCPESTLFDQTILKCNWWFYVDCKNTAKLYDTNIPVSKSYQLMKALTFFSSYRKEMEDDRPTNPEDVDGIKEAITILENQDSKPINSERVEIVTALPFIDERSRTQDYNMTSPVYRGNRELKNSTDRKNGRTVQSKDENDVKLITVNAGFNFKNTSTNSSTTHTNERQNRRRSILSRNAPRLILTSPKPTTSSTTTVSTTTNISNETSSIEVEKHEIQESVELSNVKKEELIDQIDNIDPKILSEAETSAPVRRFYRSSAESTKEIAIENNDKVQIVRPRSFATFVGEYPTQIAAIAKLDEAILGRPYVSRIKKDIQSRIPNERYRKNRS
ncbi:uncharacterized protein LOC126976923 isoform X2 [Leptidea sinapis]|uniref:uncharacterized protein LOC126976923 isoform X2 n=1 Tax=Leptidea sinapis TaxID=189913 RepID=UPI00213014A5|nr:uncharacterized protein LOC126976923 isoform X2 [Leptidea sinapis]